MRWRHPLIYGVLLLAWLAFAAWQYRGYRHERQLAQEILHRQSQSVMNALVGGIRSHRRLGRFFQDQLQGMLDGLVESEDVLAVTVASADGGMLLTAGNTELLVNRPQVAGDYWREDGFARVERLELSPVATGPPWSDEGAGSDRGPGRGYGRRQRLDAQEAESPFSQGGTFVATLLLDRTGADAQSRLAAWSAALVVAAGAVVLVCVALAWRATVRMAEARGRARLLEVEARHLRELSQAAAGLAHETRNPLGLVRGWAQQLAQAEPGSAGQRERAQSMVEECDRITSRINQFLAYAKPCRPSAEPVDPAEVIEQLAVLLQPDLETKNLTLEYHVADPGRTIQADREMLRQALFNLAQNAIHFSPEGGAVEISVGDGQDGACCIEVADRGPGVPADAVDALFSPYFTTRPGGTGLGLAIVCRIATAHGWRVAYAARPGGGAIFRLGRIHA